MANTTNFNWETPDDTDLVKDGALAIRTLGNSIDTSFVDLKGGTTGQVLSKASNTDLDYTWVTTDDANAIQNAIVDAKGDLIAASAADTPARLAVGNNGETLLADSSTATGLKWAKDPVADLVTTAGDILYATAADTLTRLGIGTAGQVLKVNSGATAPEWGAATSASFVGCSAYKSGSAQSLSNATETAITYNSEEFDTDGFHSTSSNTSRFTIPSGKNGKYLVVATATTASGTGIRQVNIFKNGTAVNRILTTAVSSYETQMVISCILDLVATDYLELVIYQNSGGSLNAVADQGVQRFTLQYLGA